MPRQLPCMKGLCCGLLMSFAGLSPVVNADMMSQMVDPLDGRFDASDYLINNAVGFLPVPIIITEPATGAGGGAALLFFHTSDDVLESKNDDGVLTLPPSVSGVVAAGTSNKTWFSALFHSGSYFQDHFRYMGALAKASINLDYYGLGFPVSFNSKADVLLQSFKFRLGESGWFAGFDYEYMKVLTSFKDPDDGQQFAPDMDVKLGSLGLILEYDSRDNQFSPNTGTSFDFKHSVNDPAFGSSYSFKRNRARLRHYRDLAPTWNIAGRLDGEMIDGDAPFYASPFLSMRGIPVMRYQGDQTLLTEVELSKALDSRWTVLGFAGLGRAWDDGDSFNSGPFQFSKGLGGRYLIARQFSLRAGVDVAWGPEETAFYLTVGSAWAGF